MLQRVRAARQNQSGFTLIELLLVIVILGILAGVVVFAVSGINDRGTKAACDADKRTVMTAVEAYYAEKSDYPEDNPASNTLDENNERIQLLVDEGFLKERPGNTKGYEILLDNDGKVTSKDDYC